MLELTLLNPNYLVHPVPYLMNLGEIERNDGIFAIYALGWTPSVLKTMHAIDDEKIAVCRALGVSAPDIDTVYNEFGTGPIYRQSAYAARGFRADCPQADAAAASVLSIPIHPRVGREDREYVVEEVKRATAVR